MGQALFLGPSCREPWGARSGAARGSDCQVGHVDDQSSAASHEAAPGGTADGRGLPATVWDATLACVAGDGEESHPRGSPGARSS